MAHLSLAGGRIFSWFARQREQHREIAHGVADNLLTSLALSFEHRMVIAPAMNTAMWLNARPGKTSSCLSAGARAYCLLRKATLPAETPVRDACFRLKPSSIHALPELRETPGDKKILISSAQRASRSTPCGSSATARLEKWAGSSPRRMDRGGPGDCGKRAAATPLPGEVRVINVSTAGKCFLPWKKNSRKPTSASWPPVTISRQPNIRRKNAPRR